MLLALRERGHLRRTQWGRARPNSAGVRTTSRASDT